MSQPASDHSHAHRRGLVDPSHDSTERGIWTFFSFAALLVTAPRLLNPQPIQNVLIVAVAAAIGFIGNQAFALNFHDEEFVSLISLISPFATNRRETREMREIVGDNG